MNFHEISESFMYSVAFGPYKLAANQKNLFPRGGYSFSGRIKAAIDGRRNVGGTMLALALANVDSPEVAIAKLRCLGQSKIKT